MSDARTARQAHTVAMPSFTARQHAHIAIVATALAYAAALATLARMPGGSVVEPLFALGVLGGAMPLLAWAFTRRPRPLPTTWTSSVRIAPTLLYLLAFSLLVLGWGFGALKAQWPDEPMQSVAELIVKLTTMAALPALLFLQEDRQRPRLATSRLIATLVAMAAAFLVFQAVFGRGLKTLGELAPSTATLLWAVPACLLWQIVEAGLCEEVLFRRLLQQRLADATRSNVAGVLWASLLFGLAHAPGLYLRGASLLEGVTQPTPAWAMAYSIAIIAPTGIVFGVLWARTRSLWLIVVLHGIVDLLPQLSPFIHAWR